MGTGHGHALNNLANHELCRAPLNGLKACLKQPLFYHENKRALYIAPPDPATL
jgi:hypothetical protein